MRQPSSDELRRASADPRARIGRYLLLDPLGRGGYGTVYRGWDAQLGRLVAIKVLERDKGAAWQRFARELRVMAGLRHPNIVGVHDSGLHQAQPYIVMDFIDGRSLEELGAQGALDPREAARVLAAVGRAIHHAHQQGVLHRDLKPANILVDGQGQPSVVDFGLAYLAEGERITRTGTTVGTPSYMAPEQTFGEVRDTRSDVYALGAVLYFALTSRPPFLDDSGLPGLYRAIQRGLTELPSAVDHRAPRALDRVVARAMAVEPADRFPTAGDFAGALVAWLDGDSLVEALPLSRRAPAYGVAAAASLGAIVIALTAAVIVGRHPSGPGGDAGAGASPPSEVVAAAWEEAARLLVEAADARASLDERREQLGRAARLARGHPDLPGRIERARGRLAAEAALVAARALEREAGLEAALGAYARAAALAADEPALAAEATVAAADLLRRRGRPEDALQRLEGCEAAEADYVRGLAQAARGAVAEAREALKRLAQAEETSALGPLAESALRLLAGDAEGASDAARLALERDGDLTAARINLGLALAELDPAAAAPVLEQARAARPDDPRLLVGLGRVLLTVDPERAAEPIQAAVALCEPRPPLAALVLRARLEIGARRWGEATADLERALAEEPSSALAHLWLGVARWGAGEREPAHEAWQRAVELDRERCGRELELLPEDARRPLRRIVRTREVDLGIATFRVGVVRPDLEARLRARAAAAPPAAREALFEALVRAAGGQPWTRPDRKLVSPLQTEPVRDPLQAALTSAPDSAAVLLEAVRLRLGRDVYDDVTLALLDQARSRTEAEGARLELDRLEAELWLRRAALGEARRRYQALSVRDPTGPEGGCARAELALLAGDAPAAREAAAAVLAADPGHAAAHAIRAWALHRLGQQREALAATVVGLAVEGARDVRLLLARCAALEAIGRQTLNDGDPERFRAWFGIYGDEIRAANGAAAGLSVQLFMAERQLTTVERFRERFLGSAGHILRRALEREPRRAETYVVLGLYNLRLGEPADEVLAPWRRARELEPTAEVPDEYRELYLRLPGADAGALRRALGEE